MEFSASQPPQQLITQLTSLMLKTGSISHKLFLSSTILQLQQLSKLPCSKLSKNKKKEKKVVRFAEVSEKDEKEGMWT